MGGSTLAVSPEPHAPDVAERLHPTTATSAIARAVAAMSERMPRWYSIPRSTPNTRSVGGEALEPGGLAHGRVQPLVLVRVGIDLDRRHRRRVAVVVP